MKDKEGRHIMKNIGWNIGKATRRRSRKALQRGFTLVEILVVITIIGLIMSLVGPRVLNYLSDSKVKAAKIQIQSFTSALELFYLDAGRYPELRVPRRLAVPLAETLKVIEREFVTGEVQQTV